ncbi:MAG: hypothetical protein EOP45_13790 [Sphingobacteriaceae bacterium]|nr:MAG: hypothetical protein EOP45_13790 [Sphingobacteriaceae bacterium]
MIDFRIPAFLEQKLSAQDTEVRLLSAVVNEAIYYFGEWFRDSTRPFFPHYTDHNLTHLEGVLATCCSLMTEKAKELFSPSDAAALILSVLFHDSAMQISKEVFYQLVHNASERPLIKPFDSLSWQDTWNDFFFIARRWDDTKLIDVFGGDLYRKSQKLVRNPFPHWSNLSDEDYLLVGEFIRQHHARFAHEAALYGIPGVTGNMYTLSKGITQEQRDIVGLIGRSHNLPLRTCTDYLLDKYYNKRQYQEIHAVYLMVLLRVADYLQIKSNRSSALTFEYKKIPSKISEQEHKAHASIRDINAENDDSEALEILAQPQDAPTYLRVQDWIHGIQNELDTSWAVIGEVYNKGILRGLGLKFRRIKSNLDNITHFKQQVDYVPDLIKFDVAHAEVLKLLIGPLYGEDPSYGVRELTQNSVDAVNERLQFIKLHPSSQERIYSNYKPEIKIHLSQPNNEGIASFLALYKFAKLTTYQWVQLSLSKQVPTTIIS